MNTRGFKIRCNLWHFFFPKIEPNSLHLERVPDSLPSSNDQNVMKAIPWDFQGQFIKEIASTWVSTPLHHLFWRKPATLLWGYPEPPLKRLCQPQSCLQLPTALLTCHLELCTRPWLRAVDKGLAFIRFLPSQTWACACKSQAQWKSVYVSLERGARCLSVLLKKQSETYCTFIKWKRHVIYSKHGCTKFVVLSVT